MSWERTRTQVARSAPGTGAVSRALVLEVHQQQNHQQGAQQSRASLSSRGLAKLTPERTGPLFSLCPLQLFSRSLSVAQAKKIACRACATSLCLFSLFSPSHILQERKKEEGCSLLIHGIEERSVLLVIRENTHSCTAGIAGRHYFFTVAGDSLQTSPMSLPLRLPLRLKRCCLRLLWQLGPRKLLLQACVEKLVQERILNRETEKNTIFLVRNKRFRFFLS